MGAWFYIRVVAGIIDILYMIYYWKVEHDICGVVVFGVCALLIATS